MRVIDFANSYVTFFSRPDKGGNIARIQVDAACRMIDEQSGVTETFYLIAPCRSERMYVEGQLFQMPNYEFGGIWSTEECLIIRTHWTSEREQPEHARNVDRFDRVAIDVRYLDEPRTLADRQEIVQGTLANRRLVARTELRNEKWRRRALLEFPVKTMNVTRAPARFQFQVDTGPLIVPDLTSTDPDQIRWFDVAHVVYQGFDQAEFIVRRPAPVGERDGAPVSVTDYTVIQTFPARNEIIAERDSMPADNHPR